MKSILKTIKVSSLVEVFPELCTYPCQLRIKMRLLKLVIVATCISSIICDVAKNVSTAKALSKSFDHKIKFLKMFRKFEKFTKVECSSSNKTCINPYCNLKAYSRTTIYMNFGCDLLRPLTDTRFAIASWMKSLSGNYRQFVNVKDIDICNVLSHLKEYKKYRSQIDWFNTTFSGFVHACPYTVS